MNSHGAMKNGDLERPPFFACIDGLVGLDAVRVIVVVVIAVMIAVTVMGMMHGYVIALDEALAIVVTLMVVYGWMPEHTRIVGIHAAVVFHVGACCLDAVVEALPAGFAELRWWCVPLSGVPLHGVVIVVTLL